MTDESAAVLASFREAVFADHDLLAQLRPPRDRDAYVVLVVSVGAERGFAFDESTVRAALREGEQTWLMQGIEVAS